jgi:hypothetical protein
MADKVLVEMAETCALFPFENAEENLISGKKRSVLQGA